MTSSEHSCPTCGSKRTTQIVAAERGEASLWCHSCGTVSEREAEIANEVPVAVAGA